MEKATESQALHNFASHMVCAAHCGHDHRTKDYPSFCRLCQPEVAGHKQKSAKFTANCQFYVCSTCNTVGHSARACKAPELQQRLVRGDSEREPEKGHIQSDAPMTTDGPGDSHADDDDEE